MLLTEHLTEASIGAQQVAVPAAAAVAHIPATVLVQFAPLLIQILANMPTKYVSLCLPHG